MPVFSSTLCIHNARCTRHMTPQSVLSLPLPPQVDDYWEPGKATLQDPAKFLQSLFDYDKDNIPDTVIQKIQPYIDNKDFQPEAIEKVWVKSML